MSLSPSERLGYTAALRKTVQKVDPAAYAAIVDYIKRASGQP